LQNYLALHYNINTLPFLSFPTFLKCLEVGTVECHVSRNMRALFFWKLQDRRCETV